MLLVQERIDYLLGWLDEADYCHLGKWGGSESIDVQQDLEDALNDIASLQSERDALVLMLKWLYADFHLVPSSYSPKSPLDDAWQAIPEATRKEIEDGTE